MCDGINLNVVIDIGPQLKELILSYYIAAGVQNTQVGIGELLEGLMKVFTEEEDVADAETTVD